MSSAAASCTASWGRAATLQSRLCRCRKADAEILEGLKAGIAYFNIESEQELENLIRLTEQKAGKAKSPTKAALRVNPDIEYKTHAS